MLQKETSKLVTEAPWSELNKMILYILLNTKVVRIGLTCKKKRQVYGFFAHKRAYGTHESYRQYILVDKCSILSVEIFDTNVTEGNFKASYRSSLVRA